MRLKRVASPYFVVDLHLLHHAGFDRRFPNVPGLYDLMEAPPSTLFPISEKLVNIVNDVPEPSPEPK